MRVVAELLRGPAIGSGDLQLREIEQHNVSAAPGAEPFDAVFHRAAQPARRSDAADHRNDLGHLGCAGASA